MFYISVYCMLRCDLFSVVVGVEVEHVGYYELCKQKNAPIVADSEVTT